MEALFRWREVAVAVLVLVLVAGVAVTVIAAKQGSQAAANRTFAGVLATSAPTRQPLSSGSAGSSQLAESPLTRAAKWKRILSQSGTDTYQSPTFKVGQRWRIVYRCGITKASADGTVLTQFSWTSTEPLGPEGSFAAIRGGVRFRTYYPASGAGAFRLQVKPFGPGTTWYFEIDSLPARTHPAPRQTRQSPTRMGAPR